MTILIILNMMSRLLVADAFMAPNTCDDLLPDMGEYIEFMEEVGNLWVAKDPGQAKKIYDVLAIRKIYQETTHDYINPIDKQIKDYICDCYFTNDKKPYSADSSVIRKYSEKNIKKLISSASDEYIKLKMEIYKEDKREKMTAAMREKIEKLRSEAMFGMEKELNNKFDKKLKSKGTRNEVDTTDNTDKLIKIN
ncbi:MAG: hypothetical protein NTY22_02810 [Proteobacteria bacterium]|nr:hypothetical protein [Pseudomonadota bacterium]